MKPNHYRVGIIIASLILFGCYSPTSQEADRLADKLKDLQDGQSAVSINNDLIALNNAAVPALLPLLKSPNPLTRTNASWILSEIGNRDALIPLSNSLSVETNDESKEFMVMAICSILKIPNDISAEEAVQKVKTSNHH
ncbi:MAG: HEAT repeat domain-containing protein [Pontiellaceae bacterium]|nr:HEAT repeat domain-containing protein [Pontiellaceae bacterium]